MNLFLRTLPGNLVLRTLLGNLFPGPLLGILWNLGTWEPLGNLFLVTLLAWNLFLETLIGNPVLGIVPGNLAWLQNPNLVLGNLLGEKRSQASFQKEAPKQVSRKRFPSKAKFLGTACKYGSQKRFPSKVPRNRFQAKFQAGTRLAGTSSQASVPRKSWFPSKISRQGFPGNLA